MKNKTPDQRLRDAGIFHDGKTFDDRVPPDLLTRGGWMKHLRESPEEKKERDKFLTDLKKESVRRGWWNGE